MPFTLGFADTVKLIDHYDRHGTDFGAKSEAEYEQQADSFLGGPAATGTLECFRRNGDLVRYNTLTSEFGVLHADNTIGTYWRLNKQDNMAYFKRQCV